MTNEPETIVLEIKLPVGVRELCAVTDALADIPGIGTLLIRQAGEVLQVVKPGTKEAVQEIAPGGYSKMIVKMQSQLDRAQYQLGACCAAARGEPLPPEVLPASPALDEVLALRREFENLLAGIA